MNTSPFLFSVAAVVGLLAGSPAVHALNLKPQLVTPLSTFSFDVVASNPSTGAAFYVVPPETATFGATTSFTAAGVDGQTITITSSETVGVTTTTDTFTVSTPTNFLNEATLNGSATLNNMQFDLGNANSGSKMVTLSSAVSSLSATGSTIIGTNTTASLTPQTTLNSSTTYSAVEGIVTSPNTLAISTYDVHSFTINVSYATLAAPEPSTWAMLGLGAVMGVFVVRRRLAV